MIRGSRLGGVSTSSARAKVVPLLYTSRCYSCSSVFVAEIIKGPYIKNPNIRRRLLLGKLLVQTQFMEIKKYLNDHIKPSNWLHAVLPFLILFGIK